MKVSKNVMYGVAALGVLGVGYYLYNKSKKSDTAKIGEEAKGEQSEEAIESIFPLEIGDSGQEVLTVQKFLNNSSACAAKMPKSSPNVRVRKILPLDEDGKFGELTQAALQLCYNTNVVTKSIYNQMTKGLSISTAQTAQAIS